MMSASLRPYTPWSYFEVYISIGFKLEGVFVHNIFRDEGMVDTEVLVVFYRGAKVETLDVESEESGSFLGIRDGAVDMYFCIKNGDGR